MFDWIFSLFWIWITCLLSYWMIIYVMWPSNLYSIRVFLFFRFFKRSLSDGNILHESNSPRPSTSVGQTKFPSATLPDEKLQEGANRYILDSLHRYKSFLLGFDMITIALRQMTKYEMMRNKDKHSMALHFVLWRRFFVLILFHHQSCLSFVCYLSLGTAP